MKKDLTILWDFDGTLFDTYPIYTKIFKEVLNDENISEMEVYLQLKISFRHACSYYHLSEEQEKDFFLLEERISPKDILPFDHVEEVLKYANKNVIMTHKLRKDVLTILTYYEWEKYFSEIVAGDDGFPRKPNKKSYEYLNYNHHIDIVIGDREIDIIPAKELGIQACLFNNKKSEMADFYFDNYKEFLEKLQE